MLIGSREFGALLAGVVLAGGTQLVLIDGRVLEGSDARRDGGEYVLTLESGTAITVPVELVELVKLEGTGQRDEPERPPVDEPSAEDSDETPTGPTGIRSGRGQTVAGTPVDLPSRSEQLAVFDKPSRFQRDIVDNEWTPTTDWNMDPNTQNNFAPSTWSSGPIDPGWKPTSSWDRDSDALAGSRSTFRKGVFDSTWTPTDGFARNND